jgi:RNA polymerase sigma factor (sigma-70 family)
MLASEFFDTEWIAVSARLNGILAHRGVPRCDRDDILQETAIRLLRSWDRLDPARQVEPYARVVAANVWRDSLRRAPKEDPVEHLPDVLPAREDTEQICMVRDDFSRVGRALHSMRPEHSRVLYAVAAEELGQEEPHVASDALRMTRMRARKHLRLVLEAASGIAVAFGAAVNRLGRGALRNPLPVAMVSTAAGLLVILLSPPTPSVTAPPLANPTETIVRAASTQTASNQASARAPMSPRLGRKAPLRTPRKAAPERPYWTKVGPAAVGLYGQIDLGGRGVMVAENRSGTPVCTFGFSDTPVPTAARC